MFPKKIITRGIWATWLTWETVPIYKYICAKLWLHHLTLIMRKKTSPFWELNVPYLLKLESISFTSECLNSGSWNWSSTSGSGEEDIKNSSMYFYYVAIISSSVTHGWFFHHLWVHLVTFACFHSNMHNLCDLFLPNEITCYVCVLLFSFGFSE